MKQSMTGKVAAMTGLAFTIGVVVGVLFHLPGTTSPSIYRDELEKQRYGSPRILHGWRERLSSGEVGLYVDAGSPYSSNIDRRGEELGFRGDLGIVGIVPDNLRDAQSWKDNVNRDNNDKSFIDSGHNPRVNNSQAGLTAVITYKDKPHKPSSLIKLGDSPTTTRGQASPDNQFVRGKILSVLQNIKVVQLEKEALISDITQQRSMLELGNGIQNYQQGMGKSGYDVAGPPESLDDSSNIPTDNSDSGTPKVNNDPGKTASRVDSSHYTDPAGHQFNTRGRPSLTARDRPRNVVTGVHWSEELENLCPRGFVDHVYTEWRERVSRTNVVAVEEGCGRMQNRRVTFQDSSSACARYRPNTDQIQGEIYSYYLSRLLHIDNVPPSVLLSVKSSAETWAKVGKEIAMSQWGDDKLVVLTKWIDGLEPAYIPSELKGDVKKIYPNHLLNKSVSELCELVQWSDLIIFDYLTANLDRVVNNLFNQQWNSQMMSFPAHNLHKIKDTNVLVFLDNESGLFHGYRLLDKYSKYHVELLSALCVFRSRTAREIERLFLEDSIEQELKHLLNSNEAQAKDLPPMPDKNVQILKQRLQDVYEQIQKCQRLLAR